MLSMYDQDVLLLSVPAVKEVLAVLWLVSHSLKVKFCIFLHYKKGCIYRISLPVLTLVGQEYHNIVAYYLLFRL